MKYKRISQANCVYLANGEDIVEPGGKDMPIAVLDVADVKRSGMLFPEIRLSRGFEHTIGETGAKIII